MKHSSLPMNLQFFADDPAAQSASGTDPAPQTTQQNPAQSTAIDYDKIQQMLNGTLAAKEDTALKAYFKQQGLSQEEAEAAMATFKAEKAKKTPDAGAIQAQNAQLQEQLMQSQVQNAAQLAAMTIGLDAKSIPYVLKMADLSAVVKDGKIGQEAVTAAINKVLEDVPALKPQTAAAGGFTATKVGAAGSSDQQPQKTTTTQKTVATKRWNRFNS